MKLQLTPVEGTSILRLSGDLDLYSVEMARDALLIHFADKPGLELDLAGVETCDAAGLQLLLAAQRTATTAGKSFTLPASSPAIETCRQLLGLAGAICPSQAN